MSALDVFMAVERPDVLQTAILAGWRGSLAHGMHNPAPGSIDDRDIMYICAPGLSCYFGLDEFGSRGTVEVKKGEWDIVAYEVRKFIRLLAQGNPNVLSLLWLRPEHYILRTVAGDMIVENRQLFVGRHVYHSFIGYAHGQAHKMTHSACEGYMGQKRRELVDKFGYDCKNGAHLIRILRQGVEFLVDGELHVMREDAQQLLEIKRGEWLLEDVKKEADRLFALAQEAYVHSSLPKSPDMGAVNELCVQVVKRALGERRFAKTVNRLATKFYNGLT